MMMMMMSSPGFNQKLLEILVKCSSPLLKFIWTDGCVHEGTQRNGEDIMCITANVCCECTSKLYTPLPGSSSQSIIPSDFQD